jgi:hypothetical protein
MKTIKSRLIISFGLFFAVLPIQVQASGASHTGLPPQEPIKNLRELTPDERILQGLLDLYGEAIEEKSLEKAERAVIPNDFIIIESGYPNWQWEDFRDNHLLVEMTDFSDINYQMSLISGELQGTLGFAIYSYTASGKFRGKPTSISGFATAIVELYENEWRIHHIHSSAPRAQLEKDSYNN